MYKIFLTLRYLTRKKIVLFPILVVWLCLMMMIIVTSIMGGFVDRVRQANHDLYGDIIIWTKASAGWEGYEQLQKGLQAHFPEIQATTPVVHAFGLANAPAYRATLPAEVIGIDPVGRAQVTHYRQTLFKEYKSPHDAADDLSPRLPATAQQLVDYARELKAHRLADQAAEYVKNTELDQDQNLDLADRDLAELDAMRPALPRTWDSKIAALHASFEAAAKAANERQAQALVARATAAIKTNNLSLAHESIMQLDLMRRGLPKDWAPKIDTLLASFQAATQRAPEAATLAAALPEVQKHAAADEAALNYWWLCGLAVVGGIVYVVVRRRPSRTGWSIVSGSALGLAGVAIVALGVFWPVIFARQYALAEDRESQASEALFRADRTLHFAQSLPGGTYTTRQQVLDKILPDEPSFEVPANAVLPEETPREGCVVGSQMGFFPRDKRGNFQRAGKPDYLRMLVTVFPAAEGTGNVSVDRSITKPFTIVDDSYTGVYDIDLTAVYVPFETAQIMAGMRADPEIVKQDPTAAFPPRCSEVLIRLGDHLSSSATRELRARIDKFVQNYQMEHQQFQPLEVQTWDERQAKYLGAVENEKVMQIFILGLMSMVVLVVIFLIFYMIVRDKTRDIGIIKAIGGSEEGVAGIFLTYGLFIGVVGGLLGVVCGVAFVTHTNQIHEWIYQMTGIVIWDRSVYLFDRIPDTVHLTEVAVYFILAVLAGVIGALIPAIVAGAEDPVQAVRYE